MNDVEQFTFVFDVGTTDVRPIVPEQYVSRVIVVAPTLAQGMEAAALMVMRPEFLIQEDGRAERAPAAVRTPLGLAPPCHRNDDEHRPGARRAVIPLTK